MKTLPAMSISCGTQNWVLVQRGSGLSARAVISSTLPVPLDACA
jgi:microcompartment protein CcmK/EutM